MVDREKLLAELIEIGIALTNERDLYALLDRILDQARRFTRAEAGTLFLRDGDQLRFAVVQNDFLERKLGKHETQRRLQAEPLQLSEASLAGHVAQTGELVNIADAYAVGVQETRGFNQKFDASSDYSTRSVLVVPLQDLNGSIVGVLELLNALDDAGAIVPFDREYEKLARALASQAAVAIRNARHAGAAFAAPLANPPKAGAVPYSQRIRGVIESHPFAHGRVPASLGVAGLPADAASTDDLLAAAARALGEAKRLGRNRVIAL